MYPDLKHKLQMYNERRPIRKAGRKSNKEDVAKLPGRDICTNIYGNCCVIENRYHASCFYGNCRLGDLIKFDTSTFRMINGELANTDIKDFIFLDTETTGLGGAGTVAFLVGIGFFQNNMFVLRQYFMRDYDEEPALLEELNNIFRKYKGFVTYNGKAFDWNLIESRFIFNRMKLIHTKPLHIDLLYPARRIWGNKLENCRLVSIETNVLDEYRMDDVDGIMIPGIYFEYLDTGCIDGIEKVIEHNRLDILSLVSLLTRILNILGNPLEETYDETELLGAAHIFEACREYDTVIACYEECIKSDNSYISKTAAGKLGIMYKRNRDYDKAIKCWEYILSDRPSFKLDPLIELAKYYEHIEKDYSKALEFTERAMGICIKTGYKNNIHYTDVKKRTDRLKKKIRRRLNA